MMPSHNDKNIYNVTGLSKVLGRTDVLAIGFGTMVGWGWIMLATTWITGAGFFGALIAFIVGGVIILAIGEIYGELTSSFPLAGGELVFAYRAMGKKISWFVAWIMALAYLGVAAWEGIAFSTAVNYILPIKATVPLFQIAGEQIYLSWSLVGMIGALAVALCNYFGIRPVVLFQVMATAAIIIMAIVIFLGGITIGDAGNIGEQFTDGEGFFYVFLMIPAMLIGFDVIPQSAEEMNITPYDIGKMVNVCIMLSLAWYIILIIGVGFAAPIEVRTSGIIPMYDVASYLFGSNMFSMIIIFVGILGILTSWNGFFLGATRLLFAMGRAGMIPRIFGSVHRKYNTPWFAILFVGSICAIAPLFGKNALIWFVNTSSLCGLMAYCFVIMAFIILRKREPELTRPFRAKGGIAFGFIVFITTVVYLIFYVINNFSIGMDSPEFIITGIWLVFGMILAWIAKHFTGDISDGERELLIFGSRFARRGDKYER